MYNQPSFLKNPDAGRRLFLQLKGFMSDTYWRDTARFLDRPLFVLPDIAFDETTVKAINIHQYLRLGNRLERFFSLIIDQSGRYEMLAENVQVIVDKVTIGELDFIIRDNKTHDVIHVELAGKMYLYDPHSDVDIKHWIGPNRRDSLAQKLTKLRERQLPLLYHPETAKKLRELGIAEQEITQKVCLKIRQFLPWQFNGFPALSYPENVKGYYVSINDFDNDYFKAYHYFMPEKQDWIVHPENGEVWLTYQDILQHIKTMHEHRQSPLLWLKKPDGTYETLFVTFW
ncbi:MAG: hypothetical protein CR968_01435 [Flavobacteriia bacterium]|nr:MAG: hypothetical protein CR968_01435 [Flavobacteriia bacterium]